MKNKYDSSVVFLYAMGKEDLLPYEFRKQIPYSTISGWRKMDYSSYLGHEFRYFFDQAFSQAETNYRYQQIKNTLMSLKRAWVSVSHLTNSVIKNAETNKDQRKAILKAVDYLKGRFGLERSLKILQLSKTMYYQWVLEERFECFDSFTQLCVKRHPQQLQISEIKKIKDLLTKPEIDHWPVVSIAGDALRKKQIIASLYSWYKYAKLFGIKKKVTKKQQKTIGLIASKPNEYLHVDTTFYPLINERFVCISFVMDNYSKMILGYHVAPRNNFDIVRNSLSKALKTIALHPDQKRHSYLVTDGGKENHNKFIDTFITKLSKHKITKIRALKDIRFSNSPVEAVHRTIKGRYLKNRKFENLRALENYLAWAVEDYNKLRPHYKHKPRTPFEVYFNKPLDFNIRARVKKAMKKG